MILEWYSSQFLRKVLLRTILLSIAVMLVGAVGGTTEVAARKHVVAKVIDELHYPWAIEFVSDDHIVITEKRGRFIVYDLKSKKRQKLIPEQKIFYGRQAGLLDVAVDPEFHETRLIFYAYVGHHENGTKTCVSKAQLFNNAGNWSLRNTKDIFCQNIATAATRHYGSRIVISDKRTLFITLGDRGWPMRAQDPFDHAGSIIHIEDDGKPYDGNHFGGIHGMRHIWSIGHRNPQGAFIDPETEKLWIVEHGARGGDELNLVENGKNYGWPIISYGRHYNGSRIGVGTTKEGLEQPVHYWDPSIAPSGLMKYSGKLFPEWKGNFFVGSLKFRLLKRLVYSGGKIIEDRSLANDVGERVRDVIEGPDGAIYFITDERNGGLYSIRPES